MFRRKKLVNKKTERGRKMKKAVIFALIFSIACALGSCGAPEDKVVSSLGKYESYEFYTYGEFQDYTDYAKYYFGNVSVVDNEYFAKLEAEDIDTINEHLADFEGWINVHAQTDPMHEIVVNYNFDPSIIDTNDYFYIDSERRVVENGSYLFSRYNVYFLDTQTNTLYYFHNNI